MLSFLAYVVGAVIFFLVGHHNIVAQDEVWGLFAVATGLALSYVPGLYNKYKP